MEHNVRLTSVEMGLLWSSYVDDSMATCMLKHFLQHVDDVTIRSILEHALELSLGHLQRVTGFMNEEKFPVPKGFTNSDVYMDAPRLYSDTYYLHYLDCMSMIGMVTYTAASGSATRKDLREYYNACHNESTDLHNTCLDILLERGVFARPPFISTPENTDFVENRSYLTGFFGKKRPLNAIEINNIYLNIRRNTICKALLTGFAQTATTQQVRQFIERGIQIANKHVRTFSDLLIQDDLPAPTSHGLNVTDSTEHTFGDKLIMFHVTHFIASGIGNYGIALGSSARRDLGLTFARLQAECALYGEDGAEIMIDNGWLEEPPMADDRRQLARKR